MNKKVFLAGLFHETNTFLEDYTGLHEFTVRKGDQLLEASGDGSPLGGVIQVAEERGWDLIPVVDLRAMPSATVRDEVVDFFWESFCSKTHEVHSLVPDGIYLVLHGAMVSESFPDVEGEILRRIRGIPQLRDVPIGGVLDLHANLTQDMCGLSDVLLAYRKNPHTDAVETAQAAAYLLDRIMEEKTRVRTVYAQVPVLWPPTGTATALEPMKTLEEKARRIEQENPDLEAVNVLAGFSFADTRDTGVAFSCITRGDPEKARALLLDLQETAIANRDSGNVIDIPVDEAMQFLGKTSEGPVVLAEPSDNIGGGAPGDGTALLHAFLENRIGSGLVVINDPVTVSELAGLPPGGKKSVAIGGRGWKLGPGPVRLEIELVSRSDGRFRLENPKSHLASIFGMDIDMGPCAVVRAHGITVLLTSRKTPPFDLGQLRSQGIEPESYFAIVVKAAVAHRAAYDPIAKMSLSVDTPGPCSSNLRSLPFRHVRRPIYPLDRRIE